MSSSVTASLLSTSPKIITFAGIPILILGVIGGPLNVIVFLSLRTFRQSSCAFYLTILSIVNFGQLITTVLSRIMISGFNIDWTQMSLFYCKFRPFAFQATAMVSFTSFSLATIDQYLATCSRPRWQQWCNIKTARRVTVCAVIIAVIIQSPCLFFYDHIASSASGTVSCTTTSDTFVRFNAYFNYLIVGNILPYVIPFSFGLMAYLNVQELAYRTIPVVRRELDKQLTTMVLVQVVYTFISILPNTIMYLILSYGNVHDETVVAILRVVYAATTCLYYTFFVSPFYIYACASERFRRQLIHVLSQVYRKLCRKQRVAPDQPVIHFIGRSEGQ